MVQFGLRLMDRQGLEWPRVAVQPGDGGAAAHLGRVAWLFFTDRERLAEGRARDLAGAARAAGLSGLPGGRRLRPLLLRRRATTAASPATPSAPAARCGGPDKVRLAAEAGAACAARAAAPPTR